jgi:hypothetical protein
MCAEAKLAWRTSAKHVINSFTFFVAPLKVKRAMDNKRLATVAGTKSKSNKKYLVIYCNTIILHAIAIFPFIP